MPAPVLNLDGHLCPVVEPAPKPPHAGGPVGAVTVTSVEIEGRSVAVVSDPCVCVCERMDKIIGGIGSIEVEGHVVADSAARTDHGGTITATCSSVTFG